MERFEHWQVMSSKFEENIHEMICPLHILSWILVHLELLPVVICAYEQSVVCQVDFGGRRVRLSKVL